MERELISQHASPASPGLTIFHAAWCVAWLLLEGLGLLLAASSRGDIAVTTAGVVLMLYGFQGLVAEILGVTVKRASIVAPLRPVACAPFLVFWRAKIPFAELREIVSLPSAMGSERAEARWNVGARTTLIFPDRDHKVTFFQALKKRRPRVDIYKAH